MLKHSAQQYISSSEMNQILESVPKPLLKDSAGDHMTKDVVRINSDQSITDTLNQFNRERHSFYPVVAADSGEIKGVLARQTFYDYVQHHGLEKSATIADLELDVLPKIDADSSIEKCMSIMLRNGTNKILVTDSNEKLVGFLSIRDVLEKIATNESED
jgi:predicted transcriptional regulator